MSKRTTLAYIASASLIFLASAANALTVKPFTDADFAAAQAAGMPTAVLFSASWCPTCKLQEKALNALAADPALKNVTVMRADYDKSKDMQKQMKVKSQSTFVVFKGKTEVARNSGATDAVEIKTLLAKSL